MRSRSGVTFFTQGRWEAIEELIGRVTFSINLKNVCCGQRSGGEGTRIEAGRDVRWLCTGMGKRWRCSLGESEERSVLGNLEDGGHAGELDVGVGEVKKHQAEISA